MYKVGDIVWYASYGQREERVPCPVCYGDKSVIVVLGNGEEIEVECSYCQIGYNPPRGYITEYTTLPRAEQIAIAKKSIEETSTGEEVEYIGDRHHVLYPDKMFDSYEDAFARAIQLAEQENIEKTNNPKFKNEKSYAWNAGYHLKQAEKCRRELAHHEEKAKVCKSRSRSENK